MQAGAVVPADVFDGGAAGGGRVGQGWVSISSPFREAKKLSARVLSQHLTGPAQGQDHLAVISQSGEGGGGVLLGFKGSSQHRPVGLSIGTYPALRPGSSSRGSCGGGRSERRRRRPGRRGGGGSGRCPWGSTGAAGRWCSRSCHAARGRLQARSLSRSGPARPSGPQPQGPDYHQYQLDVPHRSLADHDARRGLSNLLQAVLDAVDPDTGTWARPSWLPLR